MTLETAATVAMAVAVTGAIPLECSVVFGGNGRAARVGAVAWHIISLARAPNTAIGATEILFTREDGGPTDGRC